MEREKVAKKKRDLDRIATRRKWEEDKADRIERLARKERAKKSKDVGSAAAAASGPSSANSLAVARAEAAAKRAAAALDGPDHASAAPANIDFAVNMDVKEAKLPSKEEIAKQQQREEMAHARAAAAAKRAAVTDVDVNSMDVEVQKDETIEEDLKQPPSNMATAAAVQPGTDANSEQMDIDSEQSRMAENDDKKPAAATHDCSQTNSESFPDLASLPRCTAASGIRDTSTYYSTTNTNETNHITKRKCLKHLLAELQSLPRDLPTPSPQSSIFVRFDDIYPQYLRACITAPAGTPYAYGMFVLDIYIPDEYPSIPPKVRLLTTGGGNCRFGPNLYADGMVCLSLLGTWAGPGWVPPTTSQAKPSSTAIPGATKQNGTAGSSIGQVLISLQGLVLGVEQPFYLEPGHGGWEGTVKEGQFSSLGHTCAGKVVKEDILLPAQVRVYNDKIRFGTIKYAMIDAIQSVLPKQPATTQNTAANNDLTEYQTGTNNSLHNTNRKPYYHQHIQPFRTVILSHFHTNRHAIVSNVRDWCDHTLDAGTSTSNSTDRVSEVLPVLIKALDNLPPVGSIEDDNTQEEFAVNAFKDDIMKQIDEDEATNKPGVASYSSHHALDTTNSIELLQRQMTQAAAAGNYILAGQLQTQLQQAKQRREQDLEEKINHAAESGDYILAGQLQTQLQSLVSVNDDKQAEARTTTTTNPAIQEAIQDLKQKIQAAAESRDYVLAVQLQEQMQSLVGANNSHPEKQEPDTEMQVHFEDDENYDEDDNDDNDDDDDDDNDDDDYPQPAIHNKHHYKWGSGYRLSDTTPVPTAIPPTIPPPPNAVQQQLSRDQRALHASSAFARANTLSAAPSTSTPTHNTSATIDPNLKTDEPAVHTSTESVCWLRIRLPKTACIISEKFQAHDPLSSVYQRVQSQMDATPEISTSAQTQPRILQVPGFTQPDGTQMLAVHGGTFSNPHSFHRFTLLLRLDRTNQREFNYEMHGHQTLSQLGLVSRVATTLIVMMCADRGVVKRGALESRLAGAMGDAMDVDGLTYEGLVELTEHVGVAELNDGTKFQRGSLEWMEEHDGLMLMSPKEYSSPGTTTDTDSKPSHNIENCPICLGQFHCTDASKSLVQIASCSHVFHVGCLLTWVSTKSSCPVCKGTI